MVQTAMLDCTAESDIADGAVMFRTSQPLFRADPGWLYIAAGLALCALGVLIPAKQDLATLQQQLRQIQAQETYAYDRLEAYSALLDELSENDPALIRRLAASQLNLIPEDHRPILLTTSASANIADWADATVEFRPPTVPTPESSALSRIASGPHRLWLFAAGVMSLFVGLIFGPEAPAAEVVHDQMAPEPQPRGAAAARWDLGEQADLFDNKAQFTPAERNESQPLPNMSATATIPLLLANATSRRGPGFASQETAPASLDSAVALDHGSLKNDDPGPLAADQHNDTGQWSLEQGSLMMEDHETFNLYNDEEDDSYAEVDDDDDDIDDDDELDDEEDDEDEDEDEDEEEELDDDDDDLEDEDPDEEDEEEDEYEYVDEEGNPIDPSELDEYEIEDEEEDDEIVDDEAEGGDEDEEEFKDDED